VVKGLRIKTETAGIFSCRFFSAAAKAIIDVQKKTTSIS